MLGGQFARTAAGLFVVVALLMSPLAVFGSAAVSAQGATPAALNCNPTRDGAPAPAPSEQPAVEPATELVPVSIGLVPVSIYAPMFVALEKGYYAEQGLDVTLEALPGGSDLIALTASNQFQIAAAGAGPAFWNASALGLPIKVIAPGHMEGDPVATPLMISRAACESGAISSVADLAGKRVSVNARGGTEYWLAAALGTGGLTLDDVTVETIPFADAILALESGAIDAAMIGEPLATKAIQDGIAVPLTESFPIDNVLPTVIIANTEFAAEHPEVVTGFIAAYLKASRDLTGDGWSDPAHLAIVEQYTQVPAALAAAAVPPIYLLNGDVDPEALGTLQSFFRQRDQLEYDEDLDPASVIDLSYRDAAIEQIGPAETGAP